MSGSLAGNRGTFDQRAEGTDGKDPDQLPAMSGHFDAAGKLFRSRTCHSEIYGDKVGYNPIRIIRHRPYPIFDIF